MLLKKHYSILLICLLLSIITKAQNTVGTILNTEDSFGGYTLFTAQTETYLINNCGEVVNQWTSQYPPGNSVYLLEDGSLLRACNVGNTHIQFGGTGGRVEKFDWDGNLTWSFDYSNTTMLQHHDIFPMDNGNILVLAATEMTSEEAIEAGRDPSKLDNGRLLNEQVIEIEPSGTNSATIVWEWNIKDHLVQDFDSTKDNYGVISENPNKLDINYLGGLSGNENWLHINSIQYNKNLDQIVLSSRHMNEIYIIDHSTTTAQAASSTGGVYGKGGDFLYRWGNPQAYDHGTESDRKLFGQHYPHWIPEGLPYAGKLILFNNGFGRVPSFSEVFIITPPTTSPGVYSYSQNVAFGPISTDYTYTDPNNETEFFSRILSGAQMLPNGNILICDGDSGYFFEIDSNENTVWEYINPSSSNGILSQGDNPNENPNIVFRATRYSPSYSAFTGRDLTPGDPIELNPNLSGCEALSLSDVEQNSVSVYPNPTTNRINIKTQGTIDSIEVYDVMGMRVAQNKNTNGIDLNNLKSGVYFLNITDNGKLTTKKVIKQ